MSDGRIKRRQFGFGNLLAIITGLSFSFGMLTLATRIDSVLSPLLFEFGILAFFGMIGALVGRIRWGAKRGTMIAGFVVATLLTILLQFSLLLCVYIFFGD